MYFLSNDIMDSPNSCETLLISEERVDSVGADFVIREELQKTTDEEYDEVYSVLSNANPDMDIGLPMYEISWRHIIAGRHGHLHELVLLYLRLEEVVTKDDPERVICKEDIGIGYLSVVQDISEEYGIEVETGGQSTISRYHLIQRFLKNSFLILPFLFDQIFSLVWKHLSGKPDEVELAFIPSLRRLSSTLPVLDKIAESEYESYKVIIPSKVSSQGRRWKWRYRRSELDGHDLESLSRFTSLRCIYRQVSIYIQVCKKTLFGNRLKNELSEVLEAELGVNLDSSIKYSIYEGYRTRVFLSIFFYQLTDGLVNKLNCEKIVIGGLSPSRRAILWSSIQKGVKVYYIPHGAGAAGDSPNPPKELIHMVSGELEKKRYSESTQVQEMWECVVTGRPYLVNLYNKYKEKETTEPESSKLRVLVATQPLPGRKELVEDVIKSVDELDTEIIIKTHPGESKEIYTEYSKRNGNVTVTGANLFKHISESDLTVTVNSNVGLESIIVGTPTICVNKWKPTVGDALYSKYGPVPVLRNKKELSEVMRDMENDNLKSMLETQKEFVHDSFELETDAAQNMMDTITT
jgi:hypothetical protein